MTQGNNMARYTINFDLDHREGYDKFFRRLHDLHAEPLLSGQWCIQTAVSADELRKDLQAYIDPADRIVIAQVGLMSTRNPIEPPFSGAA
jgi:hypothetical protein